MTRRGIEIPVGTTFGRWTTLIPTQAADSTHRRRWVTSRCECGTVKDVAPCTLTAGSTKSCGCIIPPARTPHLIALGTTFGRLVTIGLVQPKDEYHRRSWVRVRCQCGNELEPLVDNMQSGGTTSCGCYFREVAAEAPGSRRSKPAPESRRPKKRLYGIWSGMKTRCHNPNAGNFKGYGAKDIGVCSEWYTDFPAFERWSNKHGYAAGLQIDRIDPERDYCPDNCRWVTMRQNLRNKLLAWSDDVDARLITYATSENVSPYEVIRIAVEKYLGDVGV